MCFSANIREDIFQNNVFENLKFGKQKDMVHMKGTMSQILFLGFSYCFMLSTMIDRKNHKTLPVFFVSNQN